MRNLKTFLILLLQLLIAFVVIYVMLAFFTAEAVSNEATEYDLSGYNDVFMRSTHIVPKTLYNDSDASEGYYNLISQYDWPVWQAEAILLCESTANPNAVGDKNTAYQSYGYFQIRALPGRPSPEWLLDPANNVQYAYELYVSLGRRFGTTRGWYNCSQKLNIY